MSLNENALAKILSSQFRISLTGCSFPAKEGNAIGVRATDIPAPNGFMIKVSTGWKSIEADFVPDTYAGDLIRAMGNSSVQAKGNFVSVVDALGETGNRITLRINGSLVSTASLLPPSPWHKFELNIRRLTDAISESDGALQRASEEISAACLALILSLLPLEEDDTVVLPLLECGLPEGACIKVLVNKYERSPANRAACISVHGSVCKVCGFDFFAVYGSLGHGYIEVHHLIPVSRMGSGYVVNPVRDLIPVCSNCHSILHRVDPPLDHIELAKHISSNSSGIP